ncbi:MAG TPA: hypothetical protein PLA68_12170 [Panacibacter sp.]|nr:hypothetical protein [Panacibacter sp.]
MNGTGQNLINQLEGSFSLTGKRKENLEAILKSYPYFSFVHLLLARKLKESGDKRAEVQLQKTALHFSNPFWLNYLLLESKEVNVISSVPLNESEVLIEPAAHQNIHEDNLPFEETETADTGNTALPGRMAKLMEQHLLDFKKPLEKDVELIAKPNPLYTIDYFASQGIKLLAGQQGDALTGRVKSFTEWLRQMKSLNPQPTDLGTDAETEKMTETIAQTSNEIKDVVTEAMAEVLIKQGKTEKAVQLYQKLSFLDTSKSTYFAAKIKELKDN